MAWVSLIGALAGAGATAYGASKNNVDTPSGYEQAQAAIQVNNPDYNSYFGNSRLRKDEGLSDKRYDDTYSIDVNLSPEMKALADQLQARAGASRGSYSSGGTPQGFMDQFESKLGYAPSVASYERPELAFDYGDGPAQVGSEFLNGVEGMSDRGALEWARSNTNLSGPAYDYVDSLLDSRGDPESDFYVSGSYNPRFSNLGEERQAYLDEFLNTINPYVGEQPNLPFTPNLEGYTNQEAYDWMVSHTGWEPVDGRNNKGFGKWLKNNPEISQGTGWAAGNAPDLEGVKGGLKFGPSVDALLKAIQEAQTPVPGQAGYVSTLPGEQTGEIWSAEPSDRNYDPQALNSLVTALGGA